MKPFGSHATGIQAHGWLRDFAQDVRFAVRGLFTHRALTATTIATLALGIGANGAIFSVVNAVIFRPLPFAEPNRLVQMHDRVAQLPGIRGAGFIQMLPLQNWGWSSNSNDFRRRGEPPAPSTFPIELRYVTPGYFQALGIPIRQGRAFNATDTRDTSPVVVINEALARRSFGTADPVGIQTTRGTIVGVVADVRQVNLDQPSVPELYYPIAQNWSQVSELGLTLVVSAQDRPDASIDAVRSIVQDANPNLAVFGIKSMDRVVADSLADFTLFLQLLAASASLALLLAMTGIYAVLTFIATSRTREFALRTALGADRGQVTSLVLGHGLRLTMIGLACGAGRADHRHCRAAGLLHPGGSRGQGESDDRPERRVRDSGRSD